LRIVFTPPTRQNSFVASAVCIGHKSARTNSRPQNCSSGLEITITHPLQLYEHIQKQKI